MEYNLDKNFIMSGSNTKGNTIWNDKSLEGLPLLVVENLHLQVRYTTTTNSIVGHTTKAMNSEA